jgi:outer membrane protein TolC
MKQFLRSRVLKVLSLAVLSLVPLAHAVTFDEALRAAPARPAAVTARLELLNAHSDLLRTEGDPLALRLDLTQAAQKVSLKEAELVQAHYDALLEISEAYTAALQARSQLQLAGRGLELAKAGVTIAEIRVANGSATELDLQEARVSAESAARNEAAARAGLALAVSNLEGMIGQELAAEQLETIGAEFLIELPPLAAALETVQSSPQLLQALQGLELATLGVSMLDPSYASAAQIETAKTQLATTAELVDEARRGIALQARNLHLQAETAAANVQIEADSAANAAERLSFQQDRLDAGLIAQIQFDQERLGYLQAELALLQARHEYLNSVLRLAAGTLVPLDGPALLTPAVPDFAPAPKAVGDD